jgi:hypothetical protein
VLKNIHSLSMYQVISMSILEDRSHILSRLEHRRAEMMLKLNPCESC